jgi:ABC-type uncharacterized transport system auxiliary subunit
VFAINPTYDLVRVSADTVRAATLQVQSFRSTDVYADRRIAWREEARPFEISLIDNRLWSSAPARLVQDQLLACIDRSGLYRSVVTSGVAVQIDQALSGSVRRFEFLARDEVIAEAVIELDATLVGRRPRKLLWQGRFHYSVPVSESTAEAAAGAMAEGFRELCRDIRKTLRALPPQ